jgi:hypothetical protein
MAAAIQVRETHDPNPHADTGYLTEGEKKEPTPGKAAIALGCGNGFRFSCRASHFHSNHGKLPFPFGNATMNQM